MKAHNILSTTAGLLLSVTGCLPIYAQTKPAAISTNKPCALPGVSAERVSEARDAADLLPPALRADAMIRIAQKVTSACPALAKDLLQRSFEQAGSVQPETSYRRASTRLATFGDGIWRRGQTTDSRMYSAEQSYALQLDRLSLESRAVMSLVPLDPKAAINLFQTIAPPRPPACTCADGFVPDVSIYYQALDRVFPLLRPKRPVNDAEGLASYQVVEDIARATTSPLQLAPLAAFLEKANLCDTELVSLLNVLAGAMDGLAPDDRTFHGGTYRTGDPTRAIADLVALARKYEVSPVLLVHSYREYLDRSMRAVHCKDNLAGEPNTFVERQKFFNDNIAKPLSIDPVSIPTQDIQMEPRPDDGLYWQSTRGKELMTDAKQLNFDDNWSRFSDNDRKNPQWQDRVQRLINHMQDWRPEDEKSTADYFHQRCGLLNSLLRPQVDGRFREWAIGVWMNTLEESTLQFDNPDEWYYEVTVFLNSSKKEKNGANSPEVLGILKRSNNTYLRASGVLTGFLQ